MCVHEVGVEKEKDKGVYLINRNEVWKKKEKSKFYFLSTVVILLLDDVVEGDHHLDRNPLPLFDFF